MKESTWAVLVRSKESRLWLFCSILAWLGMGHDLLAAPGVWSPLRRAAASSLRLPLDPEVGVSSAKVSSLNTLRRLARGYRVRIFQP